MRHIYIYRRRSGGKKQRPAFWPVVVLFLAITAVCLSNNGEAEKIALAGATPQPVKDEAVATAATTTNQETGPAIVAYPTEIEEITLRRSATGDQDAIPLESYLVGVVAGEMPTDFEPEALKAQAIIARTYAVAVLERGGELCDDPAHCQCYYDEATLKKNWGADFDDKLAICTAAVEDTAGEVILYNGAIAKTFFHSTCGGKTSSAAEVWGQDIPYLQSVACDWDLDAPRYQETVTVAMSELPYLLNIDGATDEVPVATSLTDSGRVSAVSYGGQTIKATDFRKSLSLNSTDFSLASQGDELIISTKGFGHGVGLCQYGANGMAAAGYDYWQIISHYYSGVDLGVME